MSRTITRLVLLLGLALPLSACGGADGLTVPIAFPPTITGISPDHGIATGGTPLTVTGTNFTALTIVTIGGIPCLNPAVGSSTSLTCTSPPGSVGAKDVIVTTATGSDTLSSGFTYIAPPLTLAPGVGSAPVVDVFVSDAAGAPLHLLLDVLNAESDGPVLCGDEPLSALATIAAGAGAPISDMAEAAGHFFGLEPDSGVLFWYADAVSLGLGGFPDGWCMDPRLRGAATIDVLAR